MHKFRLAMNDTQALACACTTRVAIPAHKMCATLLAFISAGTCKTTLWYSQSVSQSIRKLASKYSQELSRLTVVSHAAK